MGNFHEALPKLSRAMGLKFGRVDGNAIESFLLKLFYDNKWHR